jgi:hypothetical protein
MCLEWVKIFSSSMSGWLNMSIDLRDLRTRKTRVRIPLWTWTLISLFVCVCFAEC